VFDALRHGSASRAELAKVIGLSAPTVGKAADALVEAGLIEECRDSRDSAWGERGIAHVKAGGAVELREPALGRPARPLRLDRAHARLVAVQLGVRRTRVAVLPVSELSSDRGGAARKWPVMFPTPQTAAGWVKRLRAAARQVRARQPWAVLVSVPGVVDEDAGRVLLSPNLHWTQSENLADLAGQAWSAPVCLVQEIRALALGHAAAEHEHRDFLLVDFGAGVGGAAILEGRLHPAALPLSGELGHTPVLQNKRPCGCGAMGCLETLLSRSGLMRDFAEARSVSSQVSPRRVWMLMKQCIAAQGIEPWLASSLDAAAATIAGALNVLGVNRVVVTGSLNELSPAVFAHLGGAVERYAMWGRFGRIECVAAPRRRAAGLVAAAVDRVLLPVHHGTRGASWRISP
jgi:predicted NBD/HSP70 family sugar kinase